MADGYVNFDTKIDASGLKSGLAGLGKVAIAGVAAASAAIVGLGASAVKTGMDFDAAMSQVAATMGKTVEEIGELREFAQKMGAETAFTAKEAADALNYMALAGYNAEQSMEMLPNVLNLASAGAMDLARASDMITDSQTALGLTFEETNILVDQMAKTASTTNTSVSQLGDAILTIGGTAKNLSGGTNELNAVLGVLADNGIKASEAGIHLRNIMLAMNPQTDKAAEAFEALGLKAYDSKGELRSMDAIFGDLAKSMEGMTDEEKTSALSAIFNKTDLTAVNALLATSADRWDTVYGAIENASGAAQKMAATQLDNLAGDVTLLESAFSGLQISISDELTGSLRDFVQFGTSQLDLLNAAMKEGGLSGLVSALGTVLGNAVAKISEYAPSLVEVALGLLEGLAISLLENAPTILSSIAEIGTLVIESLWEFAPTLLEMGGELIYNLATGIVENLPTLAQEAMNAIISFVGGFETYLPIVLEKGSEILTKLCEGIRQNLPALIPQALDALMRFATTLYDNAPTIINAGFDLLSSLVQGILDALPDLLSKGPEIISKFANIINDNMPMILSKGVQLIWQIITGIFQALPDLIANIPKIFQAFLDVWEAFDWINLGKKAMKFLTDGIKSMINAVKNSGQNIIDGIWNVFSALPQWFQNIGNNAMSYFSGGIKSMAGAVAKAGQNIWSAIVNVFKDLPKNLLNVGKNIISGLWNGMHDMTGWIINKISGFCSDVFGSILSFFGIHSPSRLMRDMVGKNLMLGLAGGIEDESETAISAMGKAAKDIADTDFHVGGIDIDDPDKLYAKVSGTVEASRAETSNAKAAASSSGYDKNDPDVDSGTGNNPQFVQNDIYIDGRKTARVLTPYVAKEMEWEGK